MCNACTPILVGMASLFSEILLLSKMAKFPFRTIKCKWLTNITFTCTGTYTYYLNKTLIIIVQYTVHTLVDQLDTTLHL